MSSVFVPNHSFQSPAIAADADPQDEDFLNLFFNPAPANQPPGWTFRFESGVPTVEQAWGVQRPHVNYYGANDPAPAPFHLDQFAFINLTFSQTVGVADSALLGTLAAGDLMTLNVAVGVRNNLESTNITYSIGLVDEDGVELGDFDSVTLDPGAPVFNIIDLTYRLNVDAVANASIGKGYFARIRAANSGVGGSGEFAQANFDNVRLDATPLVRVATVQVPSDSNPWLAGMPHGTIAEYTDTAPDQSPVLVSEFDLSAGGVLNFMANGAVKHGPEHPFQGPDGDPAFLYTKLAEHGKAALTNRMNSLVAVFLGDEQPDALPTPNGLDFTSNFDFTSLSPGLRQPFFVGDGRTSGGQVQGFVIPAGATRLYLGTFDGFEWVNNEGSFNVTITLVPEPGAMACALMAAAAVLTARPLGSARRRRGSP